MQILIGTIQPQALPAVRVPSYSGSSSTSENLIASKCLRQVHRHRRERWLLAPMR